MEEEEVVDVVVDAEEVEVVVEEDAPLLLASPVPAPAASQPGGQLPRAGPPAPCPGQTSVPPPPTAGTLPPSAAGPGEQVAGVRAPEGACHEAHMPARPLPPPLPVAVSAGAVAAGMPPPPPPKAEPQEWARAAGGGPAGAPLPGGPHAGHWPAGGRPDRERRKARRQQAAEAGGQGRAAERSGARGRGRLAPRWRARDLRANSAGSSSSEDGAWLVGSSLLPRPRIMHSHRAHRLRHP